MGDNELPEIDGGARKDRLTDRLQSARERVRLLEMELEEHTSRFFRVCIFGSARIKPEDKIYQLTEKIAYDMGTIGIDVLTGGGPGLMEAGNKGALKGKADSGSKSRSYGLSIELNAFESANDHLDVKHHHRRFSSRLDDFMRLSNAVIVMPGGIGTVLELFFSWQLLQVSHITSRPIILVGKDFWQGLIDWVRDVQVVGRLVSASDLHWIHIVDTPEEVMEIILNDYRVFLSKKSAEVEGTE